MIGIYFSRFHSCVVLVEIWKNTYRFGALKNIFSQFCHIYWHNLFMEILFNFSRTKENLWDYGPAASPLLLAFYFKISSYFGRVAARISSSSSSLYSSFYSFPSSLTSSFFSQEELLYNEPSEVSGNCGKCPAAATTVENVSLFVTLWNKSPPPILLRELWFGPRNDARQPIFFNSFIRLEENVPVRQTRIKKFKIEPFSL